MRRARLFLNWCDLPFILKDLARFALCCFGISFLVRCILRAERRKIPSAGLRFKSTHDGARKSRVFAGCGDFGESRNSQNIGFGTRLAASLKADVGYLALLLVAAFGNER